jgi:YesN/AraC family two-component response regulator
MSTKIQTACIIDDDEIYKYGFRKFVTMKNFCDNILDFGNGKDALDYLKNPLNRNKLPDIIFLDLEMPVMTGWEFLEEFKKVKSQLKKHIDILMVTSSYNYKDVVRAKTCLEISDFIVKPIDGVQFSAAFDLEKSAINF